MASWMLQFLWHRCHRNPLSVYTRDICHAPVYTRNMLSKYRSAPGQGDCHSTWPWVHLTVRMLHDIYDMDVIISHPCHRYFFNKYGKLRGKAGSACNTVAVLPVASMSWLWHPRQCHSQLLLSKFYEQFLLSYSSSEAYQILLSIAMLLQSWLSSCSSLPHWQKSATEHS